MWWSAPSAWPGCSRGYLHVSEQLSHRQLKARLLNNPHDDPRRQSPLPVAVQRLAVALFVLLVAVSGLFALGEHWRRATFTLGVAVVALGGLRVVCDSRILGSFSVRSRKFDVVFAAAVGGAMMFLSASVDALGS